MNERTVRYLKELKLKLIDENIQNFKCFDKLDLIDKEGYLYYLSTENLSTLIRRKGSPSIFFNNNPYTEYNISNYLKLNDIDIKIYNCNVNNATSDIQFYCNKHKITFNKTWNEIKNGSHCPECGKERYVVTRHKDFDVVKSTFEERGYALITEEYINNWQKLDYICNKHKEKGIQKVQWRALISEKGGCSCCAEEKKIINKINNMDSSSTSLKSSKKFEEEVFKLYRNKFTILEPYMNSKTKIKCHCNDCNTTFYQRPNHMLNGHLSCNCKIKSYGEYLIKTWLDNDKSVEYEQQFKVNECKNKRPLPFDFAIFYPNGDIRYLVEFQGKQHYELCARTKDIEKAIKDFEQRKINDNIKREYCKNNGINLIEIPYWEIKNTYKIMDNLIHKDKQQIKEGEIKWGK